MHSGPYRLHFGGGGRGGVGSGSDLVPSILNVEFKVEDRGLVRSKENVEMLKC